MDFAFFHWQLGIFEANSSFSWEGRNLPSNDSILKTSLLTFFQLASLSTNPGNARIQINCPQVPSGLLDVSDGLRMSLPPLAHHVIGGGGAMTSTEAALNLLVLTSAEMLRQTIKYAATKCRR